MRASSPDARGQTPEPRRLRLGRASRLGKAAISRACGSRANGSRWAASSPTGTRCRRARTPRLGVVTSRKIGGAVVRSRARRLLRESFRQHQHEFAQPVELVLVARNSIAGKKFAEVEKDFLAALNRAGC